MIALPMRQRIRQLYDAGKTTEQIMETLNTDKWTVSQLVKRWDATKHKQSRALERLAKKREREQRKADAWKQNYKIAPHLLQLNGNAKCKDCGAIVTQVMRKYRDYICGECGMSRLKRMGMISVSLLLLVCVGCQTPREMRVDAGVAGQTLKVQVVR